MYDKKIELNVAKREYMEKLNRKLKIKLSKHKNPKIYTTTGAENEFFFLTIIVPLLNEIRDIMDFFY